MIREYVHDRRREIIEYLRSYLSQARGRFADTSPWAEGALDMLYGYTEAGKMLRGSLACLGYDLAGGDDRAEVVPVAAALELLQSFLLVHDDIMDRDPTRRGHPSVHERYAQTARDRGVADALHFGYSMAICVGDVANELAFELLSAYGPEVVSLVATEIAKTGFAQMSDVANGLLNTEPTIEEILTVYRYKTGRYTIALPLSLGAACAGADAVLRTSLAEAGEELGVVFQLVDDKIGLLGDESSTGKPVGSDVAENKKTLIRRLLYDHADEAARAELDAAFGTFAGSRGVEVVRHVYDRLKINRYLDELVDRYMERYSRIVDGLDVDQKSLHVLNDFVRYNRSREV